MGEAKAKPAFKLKDETLQRCKIFDINPTLLQRFALINPELFHFLYEVNELDFNVYFRVEDTLIEFMKREEFSPSLLDQMWKAMERAQRKIEIYVLRQDYLRFQKVIAKVRNNKIKNLVARYPHLDQKTLKTFSNLSAASQLIVKGGIDHDVVEQVKLSATHLVNNLMDSSLAVATLSKMITADPTLYDHSASVAMIATMIARDCMQKAMPADRQAVIAKCGLYHDVGKTCVPSAILNKPGRFTPEEFEVMKSHAQLGEHELCCVVQGGAAIEPECIRVAGEHHEKFAGHGYPRGRKGRLEEDRENGIHLYTRIVTIADVYSALLMKRVYKMAFEPQDAIQIMAETANDDYDPEIFRRFLKTVVESLNTYQGKVDQEGKGRLLYIDDRGKLLEAKDGKIDYSKWKAH